MKKHRIGVIGLGKITQDQHLPVIAKSGTFEQRITFDPRTIASVEIVQVV